MEEKSKEIFKLINAILDDDDLVFFTYKKLQNMTTLSLAEIRTIINILCEYNIVYPKKKMGLFKNIKVTKIYFKDEFIREDCEDVVKFYTHNIKVEFNKFEFDLLEYIPENESWNSAKLLTMIILSHFQANFYYEKTFEPTGNSMILQSRKALTCSDDRLYFKVDIEAPLMVIMR